MESKKYIDDLTEIKSLMNKSSRFMSLSGLSGILAGVYALIAAGIANNFVQGHLTLLANNDSSKSFAFRKVFASIDLAGDLIIIFLVTLVLAIVTGITLTIRKAKRNNEKVWDNSSKRLIINFIFPLFPGGLFCIVLIQYGIIGLVVPASLIFYGLALINASKFTLGDIKYLGVANVVLGLTATQFIGYGLFFWAVGFGVFHIIYGTIMYFKYDRA